ncbi:MAG: GNAT family N-acetyltransferase, partial [Candidatus Nanopelagicales bacterium]
MSGTVMSAITRMTCIGFSSRGCASSVPRSSRTAPWDDVSDGPFVIDLFTDPAHRRRGLATWLLSEAIRRLPAVAPDGVVGLRVKANNAAAL